MDVQFRKADARDQGLLLAWLEEPHVREFWDNSQEHRDNMLGFLDGQKDLYDYWVGTLDGEADPYCLLLTSDAGFETPDFLKLHLAEVGDTWTIDYMIGSTNHVGKGLGSETLARFCRFVSDTNPTVQHFIIDPADWNERAVHVYAKAGFVKAGSYTPDEGAFKGVSHTIMCYTSV